MTRQELHDIAVRRRGAPDVKALLLEVKRLREFAVEAFQRGGNLIRYSDDTHEAYLTARFSELFEHEPAIMEASQTSPPPPVTEGDRAAKRALLEARRQDPHLSDERALKQMARDRHG